MNEAIRAVKTSATAIWSLVLGILSILCVGFFAGIPAVICGHIARSEIKSSNGTISGDGLALAGLITGYIGTVMTSFAILGMLAAIAIPNFIAYRDKAYCGYAESEALNAKTSIACYFSDPDNTEIPTIEDLLNHPECAFQPSENVSIDIAGTIDQITITATDNSDRCPRGSRYVASMPESASDGWQQ